MSLGKDNQQEAKDLLVWYFNQTLQKAANGVSAFGVDAQGEIEAIVSYILAAAKDEAQHGSQTELARLQKRLEEIEGELLVLQQAQNFNGLLERTLQSRLFF
jgi:hypothetical protein